MSQSNVEQSAPKTPFDFGRFSIKYGMIFVLIAIVIGLSIVLPNFAQPSNLTLMMRNISISALMFLGLTWVIASGKIDVSFMDCAALTTMVCATVVASGQSWLLGCIAGLATGLILGLINGLLVGYGNFPALITTIATGSIARSVAWIMGAGASLPLSGPEGPVHVIVTSTIGFVPVIALVTLAIYFVAGFVQDGLTFGRYLYALERNERAVVEVGLSAKRLTLMLFVFSAFCASLAGILLTANLNSGQPGLGSSYFLDGLTAALLGAIVIKIGKPNVIGTLVAVVLLAILVSASAMMGWQNYVREIMKGSLLLLGVIVVISLNRRK